jgi:hypothetical protein
MRQDDEKHFVEANEMVSLKSQYIDLGLPSGTLWATCNVGANSPEEDGDYYSFHEAQDLDCTLPTIEQVKELIDCCSPVGAQQNGMNGYLFTGPNGNSIFMPAAGYYFEEHYYDKGSLGCYWSHTPYHEFPLYAYYLGFYSEGPCGDYLGGVCYGMPVRAVKNQENN